MVMTTPGCPVAAYGVFQLQMPYTWLWGHHPCMPYSELWGHHPWLPYSCLWGLPTPDALYLAMGLPPLVAL